MKAITILTCFVVSITSCKTNTKKSIKNNGSHKTAVSDSISPCVESQNNLQYAINHFGEVKKCIEKREGYIYAILEAIESDENKTNRYDFVLLDSLYPMMDEAHTELFLDVMFNKFKMFPEDMIHYICSNNITNLEDGFIDSIMFFKENQIISEDELNEIMKKADVDNDECKDKLIAQIINIEHYVVKDPDGYVNIKEGRGINFKILGKIKSGRKVKILNKTGEWWEVEYNSIKGYLHKSRLNKD